MNKIKHAEKEIPTNGSQNTPGSPNTSDNRQNKKPYHKILAKMVSDESEDFIVTSKEDEGNLLSDDWK